MKIESRQRRILHELETHESQSYDSLGETLGVSTMTVRRDVEQLARRGALIKTLGGALRVGMSSPLYETGLVSRLRENLPLKQAIAAEALKLVDDRTTLYLDGGTTCVELAKLLAQNRSSLTIVTNSALVCVEVGQNANNVAICIGGQFDADSLSFSGPTSEEEAGRFHLQLAFLSTKGVLIDQGTFESAISLIRIKQIIARQSERLVLLADSTKIGQPALRKALDISDFHTIVTDDSAEAATIANLQKVASDVRVAVVPNTESGGGA